MLVRAKSQITQVWGPGLGQSEAQRQEGGREGGEEARRAAVKDPKPSPAHTELLQLQVLDVPVEAQGDPEPGGREAFLIPALGT